MIKYLTKLDWNNMLMNNTAIECGNILKYEIESIIEKKCPLKNKENGLERNTCQMKLLENSVQAMYVEGLYAYHK